MGLLEDVEKVIDDAFENRLTGNLEVAEPAIFSWETGESYDPATGITTAGTAVTTTTNVFIETFRTGHIYMSQGDISADDIKIKVRGYKLPSEPPLKSNVSVGGVDYQVRRILEKKKSGDKVLVYKIHLGASVAASA